MAEELHSHPIHRSLLQPDLLLGVPKSVLLVLIVISIVFANLFGLVFASIGIILYIPCRLVSASDPHMLTVLFHALELPDMLEG